jgi:uncharacterized protein
MKLGIIGGGTAGLTAAWLLEQHHEVLLFEQHNTLGGHVDTFYHEDGPIEFGFEFFSQPSFPFFLRLLKILNVQIEPYPLTYTFHDTQRDMLYKLPPQSLQDYSPPSLWMLLQFKYLLTKGKQIVFQKTRTCTLEEYADSTAATAFFKNEFLYPFYAGGWGFSINDIKSFAAYDLLSWSIANTPSGVRPSYWYDFPQGASTYITALEQELKTTIIHRASKVEKITSDGSRYQIVHGSGTELVDGLIIATNACNAYELVRELPTPMKEHLSRIEYINTTIAIHGDLRMMPPKKRDWSVANIRYDVNDSYMTVSKPWKCPLLRSWIKPGYPLPEPLYAVRHYQHGKATISYFKTQAALRQLQGIDNLWLAGIYTGGIDSHESALVSAITIAQKIAPFSTRLALLMNS